jgi:plasmid stabilization system protein ParE
MVRARKSSRAEEDVAAIANYVAQDNLNAALRWLDQVDRALERASVLGRRR